MLVKILLLEWEKIKILPRYRMECLYLGNIFNEFKKIKGFLDNVTEIVRIK